MPSDIGTIRKDLLRLVQAKFPHLTDEKIDEVVEHYFKGLRKIMRNASTPEVTFMYLGRFKVRRCVVHYKMRILREKLSHREELDPEEIEKMETRLENLMSIQNELTKLDTNGKNANHKRRKKMVPEIDPG
jgi:ribose 1,5-bisphosphokinase PhnN